MSIPKWKNYTPKLDVWSGGTTPNLGDSTGMQVGRYIYLPEQKLVCCDFIVGFGASGSGGSGQYIVSLPIPAQPSLGGVDALGGQGRVGHQHDRPLGTAQASQGFQAYQTPVFPTVSDSGPSNTTASRRNYWCQFIAPWQRDSGSSSIASGATTKAITFTNTFHAAPTAADIIINFTNNPTTLPTGFPWITSITTTGFTLNVVTAPGASTLTFDWKVRQYTPVIVTDQVPWAWGTAGDALYASLRYEPVG